MLSSSMDLDSIHIARASALALFDRFFLATPTYACVLFQSIARTKEHSAFDGSGLNKHH